MLFALVLSVLDRESHGCVVVFVCLFVCMCFCDLAVRVAIHAGHRRRCYNKTVNPPDQIRWISGQLREAEVDVCFTTK